MCGIQVEYEIKWSVRDRDKAFYYNWNVYGNDHQF